MNINTLSFLKCPACFSGLKIKKKLQENINYQGELYSAEIFCKCGQTYSIDRGVPILLAQSDKILDSAAEKNRKIWNFIWDRTKRLKSSYYNSEEFYEKDIRINKSAIKNSTILEAGIGTGKYIPFILKQVPGLYIGVDLSDEVFEIYNKYARTQKVDLIMADINKLPIKENSCDIVISSRVLHHCINMNKSFGNLLAILKDQGTLNVTIYSKNLIMIITKGISKVLIRFMNLKILMYALWFPSIILYILIKVLYVPLNMLFPQTSLLPLNAGLIYWSKFDFKWLWQAVIFDIVASSAVTKYTSRKELDELIKSFSITESNIIKQYSAIWNIIIVK